MTEGSAGGSDVREDEKRSKRYSFSETMRLIRADLAFRCEYEFKPYNWKTGLRLLRHPGVACVVRYRLQSFFFGNGLAPLGWLMKFVNFFFYGVEIHERAKIGPGFFMGHAVSILITENVAMGRRCRVFHQNTIGLSPGLGDERRAGVVRVGDDVEFGGGSCAFGDITIGDRCRIGVNAVVDRSFPAGSSIFGVPGQVVGMRPATNSASG
jgi:serine O-acetyltransferase